MTNLDRSHVGIVEEFARSAAMLTRSLAPTFPELNVEVLVKRATPGERTVTSVGERLGEQTFKRLLVANELDLYLYDRYSRLLPA